MNARVEVYVDGHYWFTRPHQTVEDAREYAAILRASTPKLCCLVLYARGDHSV